MVRMIHGSLPTCEKMNNLVQNELEHPNNQRFYADKYEHVANEGLCPCCHKETETIKHLFIECQNETIADIRDCIKWDLKQVIKDRLGPGSGGPPVFYYDNDNQNKNATNEWDLSLGNLGIIPKYVEKWISDLYEEDKQQNVKYVIADLTQALMKVNNEIWKHRCKILYATNNTYD